MKEIIKLLARRLSSESPVLFKRIRNWAFAVGAIVGVILMLPLSLPVWLVSVLTFLVGITTGITSSSSITTKSEEIINQTEEIFLPKTKSGQQTT